MDLLVRMGPRAGTVGARAAVNLSSRHELAWAEAPSGSMSFYENGEVVLGCPLGVVLGLLSAGQRHPGAVASDEESALLGRWRMSSFDGSRPWAVEFRRDRTAIRYNGRGEVDIVATWTLTGDELRLRDGHHPHDREDSTLRSFLALGRVGGMMPPTDFRVAEIDGNRVELRSIDGRAGWQLSRLSSREDKDDAGPSASRIIVRDP